VTSFYAARSGTVRCQINVRAGARGGSSDAIEVTESFCCEPVIFLVISERSGACPLPRQCAVTSKRGTHNGLDQRYWFVAMWSIEGASGSQ
jgi:hypothetical protein